MAQAKYFQRKLLQWFTQHRRSLPWRQTQDPYRILVSEMMLQQTQVSRVVPKYQEFLRAFPNFQALARAPQRRVVAAWAGLGYNRRARHLHQLAKRVVREYHSKLPQTLQELRTLPGIGPYTAAAVACFAFGAPVALVDVNVRRVLGRYFFGTRSQKLLDGERGWQQATALVPKKAVAWNSALMDFGATVCTQRAPACTSCPFRTTCKAYPAVLRQPAGQPKQPAFLGSSRYWRGKVVTFLREQPRHRIKEQQLYTVFSEMGLPRTQCQRILLTLERDALISHKKDVVRL